MRRAKRVKRVPGGRFLVIIPVILILVIVFVFFFRRDRGDNSGRVQQGIAYIESLEARNPQDMMQELIEKQREEESAKVDEILAKIDSGEISVWSQFNGSAILGDSRAEDFVFDGFLTTTNVFAEKGTMCTDAMDYIDAVAAANPSRLFFTYGMNDVDGYWNTSKDFIDGYTKVIKAYREKMPNAAIYKNIPEYNAALKQMAEDLGVCWIDCDNYLDDYPDLYDTDGQHFFAEMYPIWARTMLKAAFDYQYQQTGDADALTSEVEANNSAEAVTATSDASEDTAESEAAVGENAESSADTAEGTSSETEG